MNDLLNDDGDCRVALASLGLIFMFLPDPVELGLFFMQP